MRIGQANIFLAAIALASGTAFAEQAGSFRQGAITTDDVDMLLCLAADVSESVSPREYELQREGHATAIEDPQVVDIIQKGIKGKIAVAYMEWAKQDQQFLNVDWQVVDGAETARDFAKKIRKSASPPWIDFSVRNTATAEAIRFCINQFERAPMTSDRRVIDISSDGTNNVGAEIGAVRDEAVDSGVVINVLAISGSIQPGNTFTHSRPKGGLVNYFETNVVGGRGSFVAPADGYASFSEMMKRKFLLEIAGLQ